MDDKMIDALSLIVAVAECLLDASLRVFIFKSGKCEARPADYNHEDAVPFWKSTHVYSVEEKLNWQDEGLDDESEVFDMDWDEALEYAADIIVNNYLLADAEYVLSTLNN